ncbi:outer membrane protein assembly factor BamD [Campylobacter geochelonis]|uniref:tRNA (Guanine-N(1)-)-methyltransferase n=1 Tax=Campylobacter geochelonis TaxID=1780362 RepID=A0A128EM79_9BACT|nr:outer membrane protein assembly factor BamD [Campylobacter geochelonis]QKF71003.1 beta-barrel assembly machinery complex, BamD/YfiO lipoprotein [Campylobacter geochelonis]CZE47138.1 tRNA (guanine-N(1)-)-methyltransferase [Campylobacter geochelonis]CZE47611.1 tRNA (guanine-N(1)-)-methyltransferase [Campylobacter geochelonis]CZE50181.1 tRNA (guanine-N(1)-)-methyltransferase [Campylobacter geochelonis]
MRNCFKFFALLIMALFIVGCGDKSRGLYNLQPLAWYDHIIDDIKNADLEQADKHYTQFVSEHVASPLIEPTLLILAQAHMDESEYAQANAFLDEYIRRYGTLDKIEYATFLKIKANYDSFRQPNRNQNLMQNSIIEINNFLVQYPNTQYRPLIETMLVKFKLAEYYLNENIKDLYQRTGRDTSAEIYAQKIENSALKDANLTPPDLPWYRAFFE